MGMAKYAEDNYEIMDERFVTLEEKRRTQIEVTAKVPVTSAPIKVSVTVTVVKQKRGDKILVCKDCGRKFVFTAGQQEFFERNGYCEPKRCKDCTEFNKYKHLMKQWG